MGRINVPHRYKYAKQYKFERPTNKIQFPEQHLIGIQSTTPNELLHIDITMLKILNGSKYYLQAIVDNFSRYVVAWSIEKDKKAIHTANLIQHALYNYLNPKSKIMMDKGTENLNSDVDQLIQDQQFIRIVARKDTPFSNSKIEIFFRSLKSNHLKHKYIWSRKDLIQEVTFYIKEYNDSVPHSVLNGQTPKEVYKGEPISKTTNSWPTKKKEALENRRIEYWTH